MKQYLKDLLSDLAEQIWTFVGLFSAWLVLTGSAKTVVGYAIMISVFMWIATFRVRKPKDKDKK
jgi:hypothetical protein